jgi:hypothetical protein
MRYEFDAPEIPKDQEWMKWEGKGVPSWLERRTVDGVPPGINSDGNLMTGSRGTVEVRVMFYAPVITEFSGSGVWLVRQKCNKNGKQLRNRNIVLK